MITKWYEISCDNCGCACHYLGNIRLAEKQYVADGGMVTKDRKHYCDENCKNKKMRGKRKNDKIS